MGLVNRTPAVCSVLEGTKFQRMAGLELADRDGPAPSTTTTYLYRQLRPIAATPSEIGEPTGQRTRQPVLRTISARRTDVSAGPIAPPEADLCFVSCVAKKLARPAAAKDLYTSPWFVKARRLVEAQGWPWFILSAKYGLVAPEEEVAHYEKTLNDMGVAERRDWARKVLEALEPHLAGVQSVVFLAGQNYREFLAPELRSRGIDVHVPMQGLGTAVALARQSRLVSKPPRSDRIAHTVHFYDLLQQLAAGLGFRRLVDCNGRMDWPQRGVYFFFEPGESRALSGVGDSVVRIGTHALTDGSRSTLWQRLSQHRGSAKSGGGNHRGSIFRLLLGLALARRGDCVPPRSWGVGADPGAAARKLG